VRESWMDRVERRLAAWCERRLGRTWVVAVSGGSDSLGLLLLLHELSRPLALTLSVAHLHHGTRGTEGQADALFVSELAASLGLPFDRGDWRHARKAHFEVDARLARLDWLLQVAQARNASVVALGHTLDDQAETILQRVIRGTGLRGLAGMPPIRRLAADPTPVLARPLLDVSREETRRFLAERGQPFREDPTNANLECTRARIRHDLLPKLAREYNCDVAGAIIRLGALAAAADRALDTDLRQLERRALVDCEPDSIVFDRPYLKSLSRFLRTEVLRRSWRRAGWAERSMSARRWNRIAALAGQRDVAKMEIGAGIEAATDRRLLILRQRTKGELCRGDSRGTGLVPLIVPGRTSIGWAGGALDSQIDPGTTVLYDETIDVDCLLPPLLVRMPAAGDRFNPLGLGNRTQALADFFRGRHVPPSGRSRTPLVCDQAGIVWVVGLRIAERVKMTERTQHTLGLSWTAMSEYPP
jgi:tRNA(Ile)-lysidine synthase